MHTAYEKVGLSANPYGCFMMGPSATADIGATLVHGAQGARSLTVFFFKKKGLDSAPVHNDLPI